MTVCIKCDKCGTIIATGRDGMAAAAVYTREPQEGFKVQAADLCAKCALDLFKWLDKKEQR